jgi:uncharacterized membrane protein
LPSFFTSHSFSIFLLLVVYVVGILGFTGIIPYANFHLLTPFNLMFSLLVLFWKHPKWDKASFFFFIIIYLLGYLVEFVGVKTQLIFGAYWYGNTLGIKLFDIPLMIGINWVMLVYCTGVIAIIIPIPKYLLAIIAALLMVFLDFLIEPFAIKYDLWQWKNNNIPFQNYVAWFITSFLMQVFFLYSTVGKQNNTAIALFILQVLFFGFLFLF